MTLTDLQKLAETDPERIRVMVAEITGEQSEGYWWCHACQMKLDPRCVTYEEDHTGCGAPVQWYEPKPYTTSLDACAEFEAGMTDEEYDSFMAWLIIVCEGRRTISASALHRCIAYILLRQPTKGADRE